MAREQAHHRAGRVTGSLGGTMTPCLRPGSPTGGHPLDEKDLAQDCGEVEGPVCSRPGDRHAQGQAVTAVWPDL